MIELRPRILGFTPALEAPVHVLGLQGASVVIVDDQETARVLLEEMIRGIDPGIETSLFASGIEALAWLEQREPVMVITAADDRTVRYEALEAGAVDFLAKPIDPLEVRTRCRNLLLLAHQYRSVKNYSLLQKRKLDHLQELLRSLAGDQTRDCAQRMEHGELVTVPYDKLFAITGCVAGVQELVVAAQRYITDLEAQLTRPLRRTED